MTKPAPAPVPARWLELVPLNELVPAEANPKDHDEATIDGSLEQFGYVEPILRDERTGRVVAGHGRMESLDRRQSAGDLPPDGIEIGEDGRWLVPIVRGWSSKDDDEARAYLVVSNRSSETGGWHRRQLAEYLADMDEQAGALRRLAWDDAGYDELIVDTGVKAEREGGFLDQYADGAPAPDDPRRPIARQGSDVVDLRLPMADRERDEAVSLLRQHQRALTDAARPAATLSATALEVLRTWKP